MITEIQIRNQILRRINRIPKDKLIELDEYLSKLEQNISKKSKTLSFAGAWNDLDDSILKDFTSDLINNRDRNRRRIDGE